jgi:sialate O-acetylesterase
MLLTLIFTEKQALRISIIVLYTKSNQEVVIMNNGLFLSPIYCDGMILQRELVNKIYGMDTQAETVTINFCNKVYKAKVDKNFEFCIELPPFSAGGPHTMTVEGSKTIIISDILFGDVYILSGQSNMELPIRRVLDVSGEEVRNTNEPDIRQYQIPATFKFDEPEKFIYSSSWKKAVGDDLMGFSAAGYFFAKEMVDTYHIPIGLIMCAVGGSTIEAWMNPDTLYQFGDYNKLIEDFKDINHFNHYMEAQRKAATQWASQVQQEECIAGFNDKYKDWAICKVPSLVSEYNCGTFCGSVYLCKEVYLDFEPKDNDSYIYMGTIIDSDDLWINGRHIGRTEYRYPPRKYPIPEGVLVKGYNLITVRIVINNHNGGTVVGKPYYLYCDGRNINLEGEWYYRIGKQVEQPMPIVLFPPRLPVCLYNTVVVPLSKVTIKGILWYQGESNTDDPEAYSDKFAAMVFDWRKLYGWDVPLIFAQLANYREPLNREEDTGWAKLRDEQRLGLHLNSVAMVTTLDIGEFNDLHPQSKKILGIRFARAARSLIYHEDLVYSGPIPANSNVLPDKVDIYFNFLEGSEEESSIHNFELAGADGIFYPAIAVQRGNRISITCDKVDTPTTVRYAWCDNPTGINLFNKEGLPAPGFWLKL